jgi:5-methylcytosine-specific restriction endonuclease McrA
MIKLVKGAEPHVLSANRVKWTSDLMEYVSKGQGIPKNVQNKYNHDDVKKALKAETHSKCIYCESPVAHVSFEHIEHIKPKAKDKYPSLTFEWSNLGLACPKCNMNKGDTYSDKVPFVNPYIDNPFDHFVGLGPFVYHKPGNERAELSETEIDLNRPELIERRKERLDMIRLMADKIATTTEPALKDTLKKALAVELQDDKPYSFCAQFTFAQLTE